MENNIIGQKLLLNRLNKLIDKGTFPRFSIIVGDRGSGKKTVARMLCKEISDGLYEECGTKIDEVRQLIHDAYQIHSIAVYFIPDADNMSNAAKNALLKVTEEPPNNSYFIMTLESVKNTLETILSRAVVFYMGKYSKSDIEQFVQSHAWKLSDAELDIIRVCDNPGDVVVATNNGTEGYLQEFYDYVDLVYNNIAQVSTANAFKIPNKVALKEDAEGYDLRLFWKIFIKVVADNNIVVQGNDLAFALITSKYLQKLRIKGINKQMLMDMWILDIREHYNEFVDD